MTETRSVVVDRDLPFPPARVWRALTTPDLIADWLMTPTGFAAETGRAFQLSGDWGAVECKVLEVEPERRLRYSWEAFGLVSEVDWTLTPSGTGTHLRMEQSGFRDGQDQFHQGAAASWPMLLDKLSALLDRERRGTT